MIPPPPFFFYIVIKTVKETKGRPLSLQYFQHPFKDGI